MLDAAVAQLTVRCRSGSTRQSDFFDHCNDLRGWRRCDARYNGGDAKVDKHADKANPLRRNSKEVICVIGDELKIDDVAQREGDTADHASDGTFSIHTLRENSHQDRREK